MGPSAPVAHEIAGGLGIAAIVITNKAERDATDRSGDFKILGLQEGTALVSADDVRGIVQLTGGS